MTDAKVGIESVGPGSRFFCEKCRYCVCDEGTVSSCAPMSFVLLASSSIFLMRSADIGGDAGGSLSVPAVDKESRPPAKGRASIRDKGSESGVGYGCLMSIVNGVLISGLEPKIFFRLSRNEDGLFTAEFPEERGFESGGVRRHASCMSFLDLRGWTGVGREGKWSEASLSEFPSCLSERAGFLALLLLSSLPDAFLPGDFSE